MKKEIATKEYHRFLIDVKIWKLFKELCNRKGYTIQGRISKLIETDLKEEKDV